MHRAQILLEPWQYDRLKSEAERTGKSISGLVRDILSHRFRARPERAGLAAITGMVSDRATAGKRHDNYLYRDPRR